MNKTNILINYKQSIMKFLIDDTHIELVNKKITDLYDVDIIIGYPDDLSILTKPTVAVIYNDSGITNALGYGGDDFEIISNVDLHIFAGWQENNYKNKELRDKLVWILRTILENEDGEHKEINFYEDDVAVGQLVIFDVRSEELLPEGVLEAMQYRALITFSNNLKLSN